MQKCEPHNAANSIPCQDGDIKPLTAKAGTFLDNLHDGCLPENLIFI